MKKQKTTLKRMKKAKLINFKVNELELAQIQTKADHYTNGDLSKWLRYAAIELEPKTEDLVKTNKRVS